MSDTDWEEDERPRRRSYRRYGRMSTDRPAKPDKTALVTAVDYLARQEYSESKLRDKLAHKGYDEEEIEAALVKLKERHYIDDRSACARQLAYLYENSSNSLRQIKLKLERRGFPRDLIAECAEELDVDVYEQEKAKALRVLRGHYRPDADRQKMLGYLYRKGYDSGALRDAVDEYRESAGNDDFY